MSVVILSHERDRLDADAQRLAVFSLRLGIRADDNATIYASDCSVLTDHDGANLMRRLVAALRDYADQVEMDLGPDFADSDEQVRADLAAMGVDVEAARERLHLLLDRLAPEDDAP